MTSDRRAPKPVAAVIAALMGILLTLTRAIHGQSSPPTDVLTQHNDSARTGANLTEQTLTAANVSPGTFGHLFTLGPIDGQVYAQPLIVSQFAIQGAVRNILVVATEHNSVYAFDAENPSIGPLWQINLGPSAPQDPANDPQGATIPGCYNLTPEIGITATPVIDRSTETVHVVMKSLDAAGGYHQWLYALSLTTGQTLSATEIAATVTVDSTTSTFDPRVQLNRPGLLLANGTVYMAFGSLCDYGSYHGWVLGYDARTLQQTAVHNVTPTGDGASVWQAGQGLAADASNSLYFLTGNGSTNAENLGDSAIKLSTVGGGLTLADWFTPSNWETLNQLDFDLGSGGVVLLPNTNLLVGGGKEGRLYVLDRSNMGRFDPDADHVVQSFQATNVAGANRIMGSPVYWASPAGGRLYLWAAKEALKAFAFDGTTFDPTPIAQSAAIANGHPGGILSISANGNTTGSGVVWASLPTASAYDDTRDGILRAFDAENVANELWNSTSDPRDAVGSFAKFCPPTIANGKVYLATFSGQIQVYGLRSAAPPDPPPASGDIVIHASDIDPGAVHGAWVFENDATSPNGIKLGTPDNGWATSNSPLDAPNAYVDVTFTANANTPYTLWLRLQAFGNSKWNDSVWIQFSDAQVNGSAVYPINTSSGLDVNLATDSTGASISGWGWVNGAYWLSQAATFTFPSSGPHTLRIQVREDGVQFDQIVLSPTTYFNASASCPNSCNSAPGPVRNDNTLVPVPTGGTPPATPTSPNPATGATGVGTTPSLTWTASNATSYDVSFGTSNPPPQVSAGQASASYTPPALANNTSYFWQIVARNAAGSTAGAVWEFTTSSAAPPPSSDIVIYASDIPPSALHGSWTTAPDGSSPDGIKLRTPDLGVANTSASLASPTDFIDVTFNASANTAYTLWLRIQALSGSKFNDSIWVQFSDALAGGSTVYPVNTTSGLDVNLATDSTGVSDQGWGWVNGAYWLSQPATFTFPTTGPHTLRIQVREDGVMLDQIVLSPTTYFNPSASCPTSCGVAPGAESNDSTIVPKN